ncbi:MAG: hypothetical protein DRP87_04620 [Spirochaetes bacterium]|nr:MAG: hypothetical protein DRP87_04620 [Spirochaetota bacterium]
MPGKGGSGPPGSGAGGRRGTRGFGTGRGRMGGAKPGAGTSGNCICPNCGTRVPHERGVSCYSVKCPDCGSTMTRE